jgi:hypothetical protein
VGDDEARGALVAKNLQRQIESNKGLGGSYTNRLPRQTCWSKALVRRGAPRTALVAMRGVSIEDIRVKDSPD